MNVSRASFFRPSLKLEESDYEAIFEEYYPKIYAVLFRLTGDRHLADDLSAETFWRLWERPPARQDNLAGWLYRVATRLGYNLLRANRRRSQYETSAVENDLVQDAWSSPAQTDPVVLAEQRQERERVRAVLREMSLREVQVLILRHSGLSYKEIAESAGVAAGSVGTLLSRAEAKFARLYQQGEKHASE